jgi:hypothetical protein
MRRMLRQAHLPLQIGPAKGCAGVYHRARHRWHRLHHVVVFAQLLINGRRFVIFFRAAPVGRLDPNAVFAQPHASTVRRPLSAGEILLISGFAQTTGAGRVPPQFHVVWVIDFFVQGEFDGENDLVFTHIRLGVQTDCLI